MVYYQASCHNGLRPAENLRKQPRMQSLEFSYLSSGGKGAGLFIYANFGQSLVEGSWGSSGSDIDY